MGNLHDFVQYVHYPAFLDAPFEPLVREDQGPLKEICNFIKNGIKGGGAVFIHCVQGYSRSSAALFGYIMWDKKIDYQSTKTLVHRKRAKACPNLGFEIQLIDFQQHNWDFSDNSLKDWPNCWKTELQNIAPGLLKEVERQEKLFETNNSDPKRLFELHYHFMTIHTEHDDMDEPTHELVKKYVKTMVRIQKKYVGDETSLQAVIRHFSDKIKPCDYQSSKKATETSLLLNKYEHKLDKLTE